MSRVSSLPLLAVAGAALVLTATVLIISAFTLNYSINSANSADSALRVSTIVSANQASPCSRYAAFGRQGDTQGLLPTVANAMEGFLDHQINTLGIAGGFIAASAGETDVHQYQSGYANASSELLFTNRTIIRLFSQTKFLGTVAFFRFMHTHNANGDDFLQDFLPAYANPKVIIPFDPETPYLLSNKMTTTAGSNVVTITTPGLLGGIINGDNVTISGVSGAVDGIPAAQLNGVHTITMSSPGSFTIRTSTYATAGASNTGGSFVITVPYLQYTNVLSTSAASPTVTVTMPTAHGFSSGDRVAIGRLDDDSPVDGVPSIDGINGVHAITVTGPTTFTFNAGTNAVAGVSSAGGNVKLAWIGTAPQTIYQTQPDFFCTFDFDYYSLRAANPPILLRHIMEHSVGWTYGTHADLGCTPFNAPGSTPYIREANIQSQIARKLNLGIFGDLPSHATSGQSIVAWANSWAQVPLMFDPGAYFSYSPVISLLGAVIEVGDADPLFSLDSPPKARTLEQFMQEELFDPVGMPDTMFFVQDNDTRRADILSRMSEVYFTHTNVAVTDVLPQLLPVTSWQYGEGMPRGTAMFDTGLLSTPADQFAFFSMIKRGGRLENGTQWIPAVLLAEASRTQNSHYQGGVGGYGNGVLQRGRQATWGYGAAVASLAHPFQSSSTATGSRAMGWLGVLNTAWMVDFGQNTFVLSGIQGLGGWPELFRSNTRYHEFLRCIDPVDVDLPSTQT